LVDYNNIRELENTTIIVIPMLNPDGVEVSKYLPAQPSLMLRYSRKNARGVDLNRNFNYEWEKGGTSNYDSPTFRGIKPETELEVKTLKQILENRNITFYINLHSGINAILIPAYNVNPYLDLYLSKIARGMSNILGYEVRKGGVYGGSADWALLGKDKATLSIIIELYGDKSKISEDWFLFYNPAEAYQVNEIVDKTYYTILYVLSNLNSWKNELKAENRSTLNIQVIMASIAMLIIFISITLYICKRKIQTGSS
ncbi:MAG: M14 family metallopeptidase, partial [archaeon GB-1867-097]|nr:M14 family metallopeptidase [Candidatus Culexmicrobium thermophilum]